MTRVLGLLLAVGAALPCFSGPAAAQSFPGRRPAEEQVERDNTRLKTIGLSLLLPGLGHLEMGRTRRALPYLVAEAGLWTAYGVFRVQEAWRKDSYEDMAAVDAGVRRASGQSDSYYQMIGVFPSSESYHQTIRREARAMYPDDLDAREEYVRSHQVPADIAWEWESQAAWDRYRDKRSDSRAAYRRARNALGLAIANRVVATLDAALLARGRDPEHGARLQLAPGPEPGEAALQLSWRLP